MQDLKYPASLLVVAGIVLGPIGRADDQQKVRDTVNGSGKLLSAAVVTTSSGAVVNFIPNTIIGPDFKYVAPETPLIQQGVARDRAKS
jgi:hypothetical protein